MSERDYNAERSAVEEEVKKAEEILVSLRNKLWKISNDEKEAHRKANSGTRVCPCPAGQFVIVRGFLNEKYFSMWVDGAPSWTTRAWCATKFDDHKNAEEKMKEILAAEREIRKERKKS
jgi:hypothetical protein